MQINTQELENIGERLEGILIEYLSNAPERQNLKDEIDMMRFHLEKYPFDDFDVLTVKANIRNVKKYMDIVDTA